MIFYALGILIVAALVAAVDKQVIAVAGEAIGTSMNLSNFELGLLQGLGTMIFAPLASIPIGWLSDRIRRPTLLAGGILFWSLATAACGFAQSYGQLLAATISIAVGEAVLAPLAFTLVTDILPRRHWPLGNSVIFAGMISGASLGFAIAGAILDFFTRHNSDSYGLIDEPWRAAMLAAALPGVILALLAFLIRSNPARDSSHRHDAPEIGIFAFLSTAWKWLSQFVLAKLAMQAASGAVLGWTAIAIPRRFGVSAVEVAYHLAVALGIGSLAGIVLAYLIARSVRGSSMINATLIIAQSGFAVAACVSALFMFVSAPWQAIALIGIIAALSQGVGSLLPIVIQRIAPSHLLGRMISISGLAQFFGAGLGPILVGALLSSRFFRTDAIGAMALVSISAWVLAGLMMVLARQGIRRVDMAAA